MGVREGLAFQQELEQQGSFIHLAPSRSIKPEIYIARVPEMLQRPVMRVLTAETIVVCSTIRALGNASVVDQLLTGIITNCTQQT